MRPVRVEQSGDGTGTHIQIFQICWIGETYPGSVTSDEKKETPAFRYSYLDGTLAGGVTCPSKLRHWCGLCAGKQLPGCLRVWLGFCAGVEVLK